MSQGGQDTENIISFNSKHTFGKQFRSKETDVNNESLDQIAASNLDGVININDLSNTQPFESFDRKNTSKKIVVPALSGLGDRIMETDKSASGRRRIYGNGERSDRSGIVGGLPSPNTAMKKINGNSIDFTDS
jgi:hypothetical protein